MNFKPELMPNNEQMPIDIPSAQMPQNPMLAAVHSKETAMQKFISIWEEMPTSDDFEIWFRINQDKYLEMEKQQIQDAFDNGQANWDAKCQDFKDGKEYFTKCFKN